MDGTFLGVGRSWPIRALFTWLMPLGVAACLTTAVLSGGCRVEQNAPANPAAPIVRVQLLADCDQAVVSVSKPPTVFSSGGGGADQLGFPAGRTVAITLSPAGWQVGSVHFNRGELHLVPAAVGSMAIGRGPSGALKAYRGDYRLVPTGADRFSVINDLDIDSYLKGVVASEMFDRFYIEAHKAQAVAARTFALYEMRTRHGRDFDLYDDVRSQVYGGIAAETAKSREAVDDTAGVVLTVDTPGGLKIFKAYFSSCCGGVGQSSYDAFGDPPQSVLTEQYVGTLCSASPHFAWPAFSVSKADLTRRFRVWAGRHSPGMRDIAEISRLDVGMNNRFGRPVRFVVTDVRGARYTLSGEDIRHVVNTDPTAGTTLLSSFFKPVNDPDAIRFTDGHGWGHGVGMCQWCAEARAEQGMSHEQILALSYPTSKRIRAY